MKLVLLLAALWAAAAPARAEDFSIAAAALTPGEVDAILDAAPGRLVRVADRLVDVPASRAAGQDVAVGKPEGEALAAAARAKLMASLRAAADQGRLTAQDRAAAKALAVAHEAALAWRDKYFLDSLDPGDGAVAPPPAAPGPDPLARDLRARLRLDDHGDPAQAEALDMAVRRMLDSPSARELAAEFVKLGRTATVSFEPLDSVLVGEGPHRTLSGIGGLTSHTEGDRVSLNAGYLTTDPRYQFGQLPGTLAHELLGHVLNEARASAANALPAMNVWEGDEELAGLTGWLVEAEIDGRAPTDSYLWTYLADPGRYHRTLHLVTRYYAETLSPADAARREQVYAERLERARKRIAYLEARLDPAQDWGKVLDHFETVHAIASRRLFGLRLDLVDSSSAAARGELGRLREIRDGLTQDLKDLKDPARRGEGETLARGLQDPFFADGEKRIAALSGRLRAIVAKNPPFQSFTPDADAIGWDELSKMYEDDRRDHPEHWTPPAAGATAPAGAILTAR